MPVNTELQEALRVLRFNLEPWKGEGADPRSKQNSAELNLSPYNSFTEEDEAEILRVLGEIPVEYFPSQFYISFSLASHIVSPVCTPVFVVKMLDALVKSGKPMTSINYDSTSPRNAIVTISDKSRDGLTNNFEYSQYKPGQLFIPIMENLRIVTDALTLAKELGLSFSSLIVRSQFLFRLNDLDALDKKKLANFVAAIPVSVHDLRIHDPYLSNAVETFLLEKIVSRGMTFSRLVMGDQGDILSIKGSMLRIKQARITFPIEQENKTGLNPELVDLVNYFFIAPQLHPSFNFSGFTYFSKEDLAFLTEQLPKLFIKRKEKMATLPDKEKFKDINIKFCNNRVTPAFAMRMMVAVKDILPLNLISYHAYNGSNQVLGFFNKTELTEQFVSMSYFPDPRASLDELKEAMEVARENNIRISRLTIGEIDDLRKNECFLSDILPAATLVELWIMATRGGLSNEAALTLLCRMSECSSLSSVSIYSEELRSERVVEALAKLIAQSRVHYLKVDLKNISTANNHHLSQTIINAYARNVGIYLDITFPTNERQKNEYYAISKRNKRLATELVNATHNLEFNEIYFLLDRGVHPCSSMVLNQMKESNTPLHHVTALGYTGIVELYLAFAQERGYLFELMTHKNTQGKTAEEMNKKGSQEIAVLFERAKKILNGNDDIIRKPAFKPTALEEVASAATEFVMDGLGSVANVTSDVASEVASVASRGLTGLWSGFSRLPRLLTAAPAPTRADPHEFELQSTSPAASTSSHFSEP